ncbi:MAG: hypothetical protein IJ272_11025 [Clostridia bacterium]|nr:hypothetical protein [Clostridia bacterium]
MPKNTNFSGNKGGFNLLNTPDEFYKTADQFWNEYNKPFLDEAIKRGDEIIMATPLTSKNLRIDGDTLTGYGREYEYLKKHGYKYVNGRMVK